MGRTLCEQLSEVIMDKVYYYNRNGILKLTVGEAPYYMLLGSGEFKDQTWKYGDQFGLMRSFRRSKPSYPFSIIIKSNDLADYDALCDIFSEDIIANEPGYLLINDWRLDCYVIKSEHKFYGKRDYVIKFEAVSPTSTWIRTTTKSYSGTPEGGGGAEDLGRDYSYTDGLLGRGYNYGYSVADSHYASIDLPGTGNGYEVMIYGPQVNPVIYLNSEPVQVFVTIDETERLQIISNGSVKTIKVLSATGQETDAFVYRDKENSPFLSLGTHTDLTFGQIRFDFTTIERRSEPAWI